MPIGLTLEPVSESFFLTLASISAGLIGLFLVGMIFYIQIGYERSERSRVVVEPYFRAATTITFIAFAIPLGVSLTVVSLPIVWSLLLYFGLIVGLILADVSTISTVRVMQRVIRLRLLVMIEIVGTAVLALMVILPLATGGLSPGREDLVPGLLLSLGIGFLSTTVLVLSLFDIARFERSEGLDPGLEPSAERPEPEPPRSPGEQMAGVEDPPDQTGPEALD